MNRLLRDLHEYHHDVGIHINRIKGLLGALKDASCTDADCKQLFRQLDALHGVPEMLHHENEELIRRALLRTDAPIHPRVKDIERDHLAFERIATQLRALEGSGHSPREIAAIVEDFLGKYFDHMDGEENIFFPMAEEWLSDEQWEEVRHLWRY
ncbi:hypothetical protein PKB_2489 [Pseudomonas knackmussii B13]|uniref:Hemerythrin-like domain-containing protein n=1 Tax=Pseudomonas knackmussii (strain DSM 6978 / CCUG 54928 / LMG 23759 / B13) TaxID=1301098 RepID=A0A024HG16_PSEKB|nr:hemerythrin domain-containing protein [Pseudomonas knackmussii]CDF83836.1 hypothetical protein PKB_2489 [Pseudomonas knackmussii B13]